MQKPSATQVTHANRVSTKGSKLPHINQPTKEKETEFSILNKRCCRSNLLRYFNYWIERNIQHLQLRQPTHKKQTTMKNPATHFQTENSNKQNWSVTKTHSPIADGSCVRQLWLRFSTTRKGKFFRSSFNDPILLWARISFWSSTACKSRSNAFHSILNFIPFSYS